jgi:FtsH-binding integral membrane protein
MLLCCRRQSAHLECNEAAEQSSSWEEDVEIPEGLPLNESTPAYVRACFVRKVYCILAVQLLATFAIGCATNAYVAENVEAATPLYLVSVVITLGTMWAVTCCCQGVARRYPQNYAFLAVITVGISLLVGIATAMYTVQSVIVALASTVVIFGCLTVYACTTDTDWTGIGPYLFAGLTSMIAFSFTMCAFCLYGICPGSFVQKALSGCGVLLFTLYVIYDTQKIVGGNHKEKFSVDDYAFAALHIYLDIINLFLHLLRLFGNRK